MIVLDTDVVSVLMRPAPPPGLVTRLGATPLAEQATTAITIGELAYGAARAARPELYRRARDLLTGVRILSFDEAVASTYGRCAPPWSARANRWSVDEPSDVQLWQRAADGEAAAFGVLFERHARGVYNACFRRTGEWSAAEDVTAVVFLEAWRRRADVRFAGE